jgi:carotenoid cleavage dioxygenase-like enzyme
MPTTFPATPTFSGFNTPVRSEVDLYDLEVIEGEIPRDLDGTFYRCGPDPQFPPRLGSDIYLNGDGIVTMFRFAGGHVDMKSRYVRTEKFELERAARRALFGAYRNPFTDDPSVAGKNRGTANTNVLWHGGKFFALKEDSLPMQLDPDTLETIGSYDYGGALTSRTSTAHPKIDPVTGELFFYGFAARGETTPDIAFSSADRNGRITREVWFRAPYSSMVHDFAVTRDYVIFPIIGLTSDLERLRAGGSHYVWDPSRDFYVGIMPRDGGAEDLRWFRGPTRFVSHMLNAFNDGTTVHLDLPVAESNMFPFFPNIDGTPFDRSKAIPSLCRMSFDMATGGESFEQATLVPLFCEFPIVDPRVAMSEHRYGFVPYVDRSFAPPVGLGGATGLNFNCIGRIDTANGTVTTHFVGENATSQEPMFVPRTAAGNEGDGYVIVVLNRYDEQRSDLLLLDAQHLDAPPVARMRVPLRLRNAFHGIWVSAADRAAGDAIAAGAEI